MKRLLKKLLKSISIGILIFLVSMLNSPNLAFAESIADSFADTTKINTGASSGYEVAGGQLKASRPIRDWWKMDEGSGNSIADSSGSNTATAYTQPATGWWKMDEASGSNVADSSGNGNNGVMYATAATGGTITYSGGYTIHTFTSSGTLQVLGSFNVESLVVGGGGGGGSGETYSSPIGDGGGGGGGGGIVYTASHPVTLQGYTVTVGTGGSGGSPNGASGTAGISSTFAGYTGTGGGYGSGGNSNANGGNGGSGGGAGNNYGFVGYGGTGSQGYNGGDAALNPNSWRAGSGGGGKGSVGTTRIDNGGGGGGAGAAYSISGSSLYYSGGGGGGGSSWYGGGAGGSGVGGAGGAGVVSGASGTAGMNERGGGGGGGGASAGDSYGGGGGNGIVIIRYPTPSSSIVAGKYSNARIFNGSSDYIDIPNSTVFDSTQYTINAWVYSTNYTQSGFIFEKGPVNTQYSLFFEGTNIVQRSYNSAGANCINQYTSLTTAGISNSNWYHISSVYDGTNIILYVDGVQKSSVPVTCTLRTGQTGERIGAYGGAAPAYFFNGIIDDVRVYNYTVSQAGIQSDMNNYQYTGPAVVTGNYGNARSFDGGHDYANVASPTNLPTGSVMTAEAWVYPKGYTSNGTYNGIVSWGPRTCTGSSYLMSVSNNGKLSFASWCNDAYQTAGSSLTLNAWNHVAVVLNGTTVQFYLGGVLQDTKTVSNGTPPNVTSGVVYIGSSWGNGSMFQGYIDDVRIYSIALNQAQIANDMNNVTNYSTSSTIVSTNLLTGLSGVDGIDEFVYNLSSKPVGSTATVQFSQNGTSWYNSSNVLNGTDTLTTGTNNTINIHALGWSGANFYYKVAFTNDGTNTPVLDDVNVNYTKSGYTNTSTGVTDNYTGTSLINTSSSSDYVVNAGTLNMERLPNSAYWKMDEASGTNVADSSVNGNNGTQYGAGPSIATGGTITYSGGYTIHKFTSSGTFALSQTTNIETLVVAGGGGGGYSYGAGGGGGGVITEASHAHGAANYGVTVGNGGGRTGNHGANGENSVFDNVTATGGGGGSYWTGSLVVGWNGGSGGGGSHESGGGTGTSGQGYNGGSAVGSYYAGAGGGGAGGVGGAPTGTGMHIGGAGAAGVSNSISGSAVWYAGGGSGNGDMGTNAPGSGGTVMGQSGAVNTGAGAGGDGATTYFGGSGIVVVRYLTPSNIVGGKYSYARSFNGTSDYVSVANNAAFNPTTAFTVEAWVKLNSLPGVSTNYNIVVKEAYCTQGYRLLSVGYGNGGKFYLLVCGLAGTPAIVSTTVPTVGIWYHVAGVYDGSNLKLYVNGTSEGTPPAASGNITNTAGALTIGSAAGGEFMDGTIDDVRIYNYARTLAQIQYDMNNTPATSATIQSTNLLSGISSINSIDSFAYSLTSLPANTTATVQFSRDTYTWYNSSGVSGGTNSLSAGTNTISLSGLAWSGPYFFYKIVYTSTGAETPSMDYITVNYSTSTSTIGSTWAACIPQTGGDFTLSTNCYFPNTRFSPSETNVDGVDNGNLTIQAYKTLTIRGDQQIARNNGKSITIQNGGSIAINDIPIGGNGGNVRDYSGNGNEGTPGTAVATTVVAGKYGTARNFNGSTDYISLGDATSLKPSNLTVETWFKTNTTNGSMLIRKRGFGYGLEIGNFVSGAGPGQITFWIYDSAPTLYKATSPLTYNDGAWHHAAGVYNGSTVTLYIDGNFITSNAAGTITYNNGLVALGRDGDSSAAHYNGSLDDVRFYNYALTQAQLTDDMNYGSVNKTGPVAWYRFEDGGQIKETNLWVQDQDGDGWAQSYETQQRAQNDTPGTGWVRRYLTIGSAFGDARDGNITFTTNTNLNTWNHTGRTCADGGDAVAYSVSSLGSTTLPNSNPVSTATLTAGVSTGCINAGDNVLVINQQGTTANTTNVGNYELLKVYSVSGSTVTFTSAKKKYYGNGASDDTNLGTATSNQRVMMQRVPQFGSVTVNSGVELYPNSWDGTKGGVLAFVAKETVTVTGTIQSWTRGYRGSTALTGGGEAFCSAAGGGAAGNGGAGGQGGDYAGCEGGHPVGWAGNPGAAGGNAICGGGGGASGGGGGGGAGEGPCSGYQNANCDACLPESARGVAGSPAGTGTAAIGGGGGNGGSSGGGGGQGDYDSATATWLNPSIAGASAAGGGGGYGTGGTGGSGGAAGSTGSGGGGPCGGYGTGSVASVAGVAGANGGINASGNGGTAGGGGTGSGTYAYCSGAGNGGGGAGGGGGGGTYGNTDLSKMFFGSGGGKGGAAGGNGGVDWALGNPGGSAGAGGTGGGTNGGTGGGIILIHAKTLTATGAINASGAAPGGNGGGGAGGSIKILGETLTLGTSLVVAPGGGNGGSGRVAIGGITVTGSANPTFTAISAP